MSIDGIPDIGAMLGEVMRDPEKMTQLRTIMASLGAEVPSPEIKGASEPSRSAAQQEARLREEMPPSLPPSAPSSPDMLGSLLSNPALLSQLPALLSTLGGAKDDTSTAQNPHRRPDHRTALLLALKPYLNDGRRQMIDYIVNISRLGDQLGH